ncbi:hypothetical protein B1219_23880 [Pseudomonas ogarae]|nr:hypothetical protein B1219_23880 [Pseudomonas ogarae]OPG77363.1 hypothetical protein B1218_21195 [Pseudomonas ogarae]
MPGKYAQVHCGSELARDSGGSACISVECAAAIASKLAPTQARSHSAPSINARQTAAASAADRLGTP